MGWEGSWTQTGLEKPAWTETDSEPAQRHQQTPAAVPGDRAPSWQPARAEGKLCEVPCLWKQCHTHFIHHCYTLTSSITHSMLPSPQHQTGFPSVLPHKNNLSPCFTKLFMGNITWTQLILNLGALKYKPEQACSDHTPCLLYLGMERGLLSVNS